MLQQRPSPVAPHVAGTPAAPQLLNDDASAPVVVVGSASPPMMPTAPPLSYLNPGTLASSLSPRSGVYTLHQLRHGAATATSSTAGTSVFPLSSSSSLHPTPSQASPRRPVAISSTPVSPSVSRDVKVRLGLASPSSPLGRASSSPSLLAAASRTRSVSDCAPATAVPAYVVYSPPSRPSALVGAADSSPNFAAASSVPFESLFKPSPSTAVRPGTFSSPNADWSSPPIRQPTPSSVSSKTPLYHPTSAVTTSSPVLIAASQLADLLTAHSADPSQRPLLVVDVRGCVTDPSAARVAGSVGVVLPPLILKRFRRGGGASFRLESFLFGGPDARRAFDAWRAHRHSAGNDLVVIGGPATDDNAQLLARVLARSGASATVPTTVYVVAGGFESLTATPAMAQWILPPPTAGSTPSAAAAVVPAELSGVQHRRLLAPPPKLRDLREPDAPAPVPGAQPQQAARRSSRSSPRLPGFAIDTSPVAGCAASPRTLAGASLAAAEANAEATAAGDGPAYAAVRPYLLLGNDALPTSRDPVAAWRALGVTHVLNVATEVAVPEGFDTAAAGGRGPGGIVYRKIGMWDHPDAEELAAVIRDGLAFIDEALASTPAARIFVHCQAGRSRSATVVLAHLMRREGLALAAAYEDVRTARGGILPNIGFMAALVVLEREQELERAAAAAAAAAASGGGVGNGAALARADNGETPAAWHL